MQLEGMLAADVRRVLARIHQIFLEVLERTLEFPLDFSVLRIFEALLDTLLRFFKACLRQIRGVKF